MWPSTYSAVSLDALLRRELIAPASLAGHMRVVYEEIVEMETGAVKGHEALTRIRTDASESVDPQAWFAAARSLGSPAKIEARAAHLALSDLPPGKGLLAINFSPDCLATPEVQGTLDRLADLDRTVVVELAEHHHVTPRTLDRSLGGIRDRGLLVAVDDVGMGESGPEFVRQVHPDIIKVDNTHTDELHKSRAQQDFLLSYIQMAHSENAILIAEGVETPQVAVGLRRLARTWDVPIYGQGYWLSELWQPDGVFASAQEAI